MFLGHDNKCLKCGKEFAKTVLSLICGVCIAGQAVRAESFSEKMKKDVPVSAPTTQQMWHAFTSTNTAGTLVTVSVGDLMIDAANIHKIEQPHPFDFGQPDISLSQ